MDATTSGGVIEGRFSNKYEQLELLKLEGEATTLLLREHCGELWKFGANFDAKGLLWVRGGNRFGPLDAEGWHSRFELPNNGTGTAGPYASKFGGQWFLVSKTRSCCALSRWWFGF
jgi:hypothetical protein